MTGARIVPSFHTTSKHSPIVRRSWLILLFCLLVHAHPATAQISEDETAEELAEAFDHKNWYTLEMLVFSRPLEDASVLENNDPNLEQLRLQRQIKLPALLKTLVPAYARSDSPPNIGMLNALLNSYKYRTTAESAQPGAIPELDNLLLWLSEIKDYGGTGLEVLEQLGTAGQYWPYIEPLFVSQPKRLTQAASNDASELLDNFRNDDALLIEIPTDLAFRTSADLRLIKEANALAANGRHKVLWHQAWHQPLPPRGKGVPILIQGEQSKTGGADAPSDSLDGLVTVELGRFLHARIQLWAQAPESRETRGREVGFIEFDARVRLRSKEYHYLDHPYLGVVMLIVPLTPKPDRLSPDRYSF